jgi:hypothetical protein
VPKRIKGGYCYLCGAYRNTLTRDHVPPKNLAPRTPDTTFLYAYACSSCNNKSSHDESKFRDFLAVACSCENIPEANDAFEAFKRNIQRNDLGRAGMPHKDLTRILQGIDRKDIYTLGSIYLGTVSTITPAPDIDIQGILLKIARGLQVAHAGVIIPARYTQAACLYGHTSPRVPVEGIDKTHVVGSVGNFFHYRGGWASDDPKACIWYMMFYSTLIGIAIFRPPHTQ